MNKKAEVEYCFLYSAKNCAISLGLICWLLKNWRMNRRQLKPKSERARERESMKTKADGYVEKIDHYN